VEDRAAALSADPLEAFFPPCQRLDCERAGTPHADVLPAQRQLIESAEKYVCMMGGFGAAKTMAAAVLGVTLSLAVPGNSGIVLRRSYPNLKDSTMRTYLEVLDYAGIPYERREVRDGWPFHLILPNASEITFRESKDHGRKLGSAYGWFHVDEAAEEPVTTFSGFFGRLRLAAAAGYLKGILTTNPPHHQHWIADYFGLTPGTQTRSVEEGGETIDTSFRLIRVSTRDNPFLPRAYVADLRAVHSAGEARRVIDGEYGFTFDGTPVLAPPFDFGRHVTQLERLAITTVVSWDFGFRHPVLTWQQFPVCKSATVHWHVLGEYGGRDIISEDLVPILRDKTAAWFPTLKPAHLVHCGDHAGAQIGEKGPGPIIRLARAPYRIQIKHRPIANVDPGLALIRQAMRQTCPCGAPVFAIDRSCRETLDAFAGGYHFPVSVPGRAQPSTAQKPVKDGIYDNFVDSVRYAGENFYRALLRDPRTLEALMERRWSDGPGAGSVQPAAWAWMEGARRVG